MRGRYFSQGTALVIEAMKQAGILIDPEGEWLPLPEQNPHGEGSPLYAGLQRAVSLGYSTMGPLDFGPVRKLGKSYGWQGEPSMSQSPFCARKKGISLHCARRIKASKRRELEQLISYATRPPLSEQRLKKRDDGRLEFKLKRSGTITSHCPRKSRDQWSLWLGCTAQAGLSNRLPALSSLRQCSTHHCGDYRPCTDS